MYSGLQNDSEHLPHPNTILLLAAKAESQLAGAEMIQLYGA